MTLSYVLTSKLSLSRDFHPVVPSSQCRATSLLFLGNPLTCLGWSPQPLPFLSLGNRRGPKPLAFVQACLTNSVQLAATPVPWAHRSRAPLPHLSTEGFDSSFLLSSTEPPSAPLLNQCLNPVESHISIGSNHYLAESHETTPRTSLLL